LNNILASLLFWLLGSVLTYALATNALWLARSFFPLRARDRHPERSEGSLSALARFFASLRRTWTGWLWQIGRFLFYVGIPYLVLGGWPRRPFQGLLSLEDMGLVGPGGSWTVSRWLEAAGTGLGLGTAALMILFLARRHANNLPHFPRHPQWTIVINVAYLEVHWAFYRAASALLLGDRYLGVFAGLGLVYVEWVVSPLWRRGWRQESQAAGQWLRAALALVIAVLFFLAQNLWICLAVHCLLELVFYSHNRQKAHTSPAVVG
jgi:hypothetical protein